MNNIKAVCDGIEVLMEDYTNSLQDVKNIRKVEDHNKPLTKLRWKNTGRLQVTSPSLLVAKG